MVAFDRKSMVAAFERIGLCAIANVTRLELAIYGGSALMLASNFRFATEDVDIADIGRWPDWLEEVVKAIGDDNDWSEDWMNDAVTFHLSPLAARATDHVEFGMFPTSSDGFGLSILVPTPEYMLALKLKAMRTTDPLKGRQEADDIHSLMKMLQIPTVDKAIETLTRFFPNSGAGAEKQRFLLKNLKPSEAARRNDAPTYAR